MIRIARYALTLAIAVATAGTAAAQYMPSGAVFDETVSFSTSDLAVADQTARKCVLVNKAGHLGSVACHRHSGTGVSIDVWVLTDDLSVYPAATGTSQAIQLAHATGITGRAVLTVNQDFVSLTTGAASGKLCIQAVTNGGDSAVECVFRGRALATSTPN